MSTARARRAQPAPALDILMQSPLWKKHSEADAALRRAIGEAAAAVSTSGGELAIVLTDDSAIRAMNRKWRSIDKATNVLSFPSAARPKTDGGAAPLGDIVIAYETTEREADEQGTPFMHHLVHLAVHGFLHLVGHDHETDEDAETMEEMEIAILARLDIPDPYLARDAD